MKKTLSIPILMIAIAIMLSIGVSACLSDEECGSNEYCAKPAGQCDGDGECAANPQACQQIWQPVCGCDDALYFNSCEAEYFGVSVANSGACQPSADDPGELQICDYVLTNFRVQVGNTVGSRLTYSDEGFNAYTTDGKPIGHLALKDRKVISVNCELLQTPSYNVYVKDLATIQEIFNAQNRLDVFEEKLSDDSIKLEGIRFSKKVKGSMTKAVLKVWSWFS